MQPTPVICFQKGIYYLGINYSWEMREIVDKSEYSVINDSRSAVSFPIIKILFDCHKVSDILVANNSSYFGG